MIFDSLENAQFYYPLSDKIKEAFYFIKSTDWKNLEPGKYVYKIETQIKYLLIIYQHYFLIYIKYYCLLTTKANVQSNGMICLFIVI